jgi:NitT/TauT family transport system substrate-binding protein
MGRRFPGLKLALIALTLALLLQACAGGRQTTSAGAKPELRLGYFPNLTHASAIAGVDKSLIEKSLSGRATLKTFTFNAGPQVVEAIFSNGLDASYIGPNPAINAFTKSNGEAVRIISGATSGGASLVVQADISSAQDLKGKKLATPQLGNTQDVALRAWLAAQDLKTDLQGGGDVSIVNQANAEALEAFRSGAINGAWVPEPWASRMILEGKGKQLLNETELWPGGRFVTTLLIVRKAYLDQNRPIVRSLLQGHLAANSFVGSDPTAKSVINSGLKKLTGKALSTEVIDMAWKNLTFTYDPVAGSLRKSAADAKKLGLLEDADLDGIFDLALLNELLGASGSDSINP